MPTIYHQDKDTMVEQVAIVTNLITVEVVEVLVRLGVKGRKELAAGQVELDLLMIFYRRGLMFITQVVAEVQPIIQ